MGIRNELEYYHGIQAGGTAGDTTAYPILVNGMKCGSTLLSATQTEALLQLATTATALDDLGYLNGVTAGTAAASKVVALDANSLVNGTNPYKWDKVIAAAGSAFAPSSSSEAKMNLGGYTIAANRLKALGVIEFEAVALVGAINATDTFTLNVRIGAADDATGTVVGLKVLGATTAANDYAIVRGRIDIRSIATTTCTMTSVYTAGGLEAGAASSIENKFVGAFTKDSTAALYLNACGKFSTNSGTNSATLQAFSVKIWGA